jgi:cytoskeletal protein RodZ
MPEGKQAAAAQDPFSIGAYLKAQRKLRDIGLEELATRTRIPLRSLKRLEQGTFDRDPDGFVRGFVRTVSLALGLDPDDTLMRMLAEPTGGTPKRKRAGPPLRTWLALTAGLAAAVAGAALLHAALWNTPTPTDERTVIRRDPVRALAEAHEASPTRPETNHETKAASQTGLPEVSAKPN